MDKITITLDREDAIWLYEDLYKRKNSVSGVAQLIKKALKGSKRKAELEKLDQESEHMNNIFFEMTFAFDELGYLEDGTVVSDKVVMESVFDEK